MAKNKTYYWLKLKCDFFRQKEIKKLRQIAGGDTYAIIYLKMQLLSLQDAGKLFFDGVEDSFVGELALELDEDVDNVQVTFDFLKRHGLVEIISEDELILPQTVDSIGSEGNSAERVRKHRDKIKNKTLLSNTNVTSSNDDVTYSNTEIEIELDLDLDIETEKGFLSFWNEYPRKIDKAKTYTEWAILIKRGYSILNLAQSAINYSSAVVGYASQYIKHPKNFLADKSFSDYLPNTFIPEASNIVPMQKKQNSFNNFPQRQYTSDDYTKLEKQLMNKSL
jgi:predicted phage replisome organizer